MKKLLCIVCLLASVLFVNAADASIGSPMRSSRGSFTINTVRVAASCTTCGHVAARPVSVVKPVVHVSSCTTCGRGFRHRPMHRGFRTHAIHGFHGRHFGRRGFHGRHFGHRGFHGRHFGHRGFHGRRFACNRCGR